MSSLPQKILFINALIASEVDYFQTFIKFCQKKIKHEDSNARTSLMFFNYRVAYFFKLLS